MKTDNEKRRGHVAIVMAVTVIIGMAGGDAANARKPPKESGLVETGDPVDCIMPSRIRSTRILDDRTIDFEMIGRETYRNVLPRMCPGLGFEERFSYRLSTSQLCSVDVITVLRSGGGGFIEGPSCGLGKFQKMAKPGKTK